MLKRNPVDLPLLIIAVLLAVTLAAFFAGWFPYPFGFLILGVALLGRLLHVHNRR